jgi:glycosyltransferase involved in cell wall biosynthesis
MRILQIAPAWVDTPPKDYGGTEWVIANLVKGLRELGFDVTLFATKASEVDVKVEYLFEKGLLSQNISWTAALPALLHFHEAFKQAYRFDIVHAHLSSETDLITLPFLADLTEKGIPNLATIHSPWPFDYSSGMDKTFINLYADKILAVNISSFMQKNLPPQFRDGGFVYNSVDLSKMKFNGKSGDYLTWLGRIIPEKGTAEAIRIAKMAGEQLIFGGIIDQYNPKSVKYWKEVVKPQVDGRQIKYLGPADLKLKNKLMGGAKAFLNPITWDEPFGMVIVESLACGTPVISYRKGAMAELVKDGKTGFLVKDRAGMKRAIKKVSEIDRSICREDVERRFSPSTAALKYARLYQQEIQLQEDFTREDFNRLSIGPEDIFIGRAHSAVHSLQLRKKHILSSVSD